MTAATEEWAQFREPQSLEATEAIDFTTTNLEKWAEVEGNKVDVVVDSVGKKSLKDMAGS